jgi:hypothetical protein
MTNVTLIVSNARTRKVDPILNFLSDRRISIIMSQPKIVQPQLPAFREMVAAAPPPSAHDGIVAQNEGILSRWCMQRKI